MTFLAPGYLLAALAAAALVVVAHLIAWRQPPDFVLPTARFVPDEAARRSARAVRLSDIALMGVRVAVVLLAGLALARPVVAPVRRGTALLVAADVSGETASLTEVRDSLAAVRRDGVTEVVLGFDTAVRVLRKEDLGAAGDARPPGALSSLLVALVRERERLARTHERVEIAVVSPFASAEFDAATLPLRALLPDSIRMVRVRGAVEQATAVAREVAVRADGDDAVAAGVRLGLATGRISSGAPTRVVRGALRAEDSAWVAAGDRVLLWWPRASVATSASVAATPAPAEARGVSAGDATVIGYLQPTGDPTGVPIARWLDGASAAGETRAGAGCLRHVAFEVPASGDLTLTSAFQRLVGELARPCAPRGSAPAAESLRARLAAPPAPEARSLVRQAAVPSEPNRVGALLLALGIAAAAAETALRRRRPSAAGPSGLTERGRA